MPAQPAEQRGVSQPRPMSQAEAEAEFDRLKKDLIAWVNGFKSYDMCQCGLSDSSARDCAQRADDLRGLCNRFERFIIPIISDLSRSGPGHKADAGAFSGHFSDTVDDGIPLPEHIMDEAIWGAS